MSGAPGVSPQRVVRRNALWNILGVGIPSLVAAFFIPYLIRGMGTDRFGVLILILAFLNYFGLFDLGIGRAMTQWIAGRDGEDKREENTLIWTVSAALWVLGIIAGALLFWAAPFMTARLLNVRGELAAETIPAVRTLAFVLPFLLHGLALKGVLEAKRRFDLSNLVRIPTVAFTFLAPLLVIPFSTDLRVLVPVVLGGRILAWALNVGMVLYLLPHLRRPAGWRLAQVGALVRLGGWFSVSGAAAAVIDSMDRFFISALLSISLVAYYATPYELILKLGILYGGVGTAIFPEFALRYGRSLPDTRALFARSVKYLVALIFPFTFLATAYAHEGLSLWLDPAFADLSAPVLRWLSLFVLMIAATLTPYLFLGGAGRPDLWARMHLAEIPVHAVLLYVLIKADGIRGAAIACVIRMFIDFFGMLFFSGRLLGFRRATYARLVVPLAGMVATLLAFHLSIPSGPKAILAGAVLAVYGISVWLVILEPADKDVVRGILRRKWRSNWRGRET